MNTGTLTIFGIGILVALDLGIFYAIVEQTLLETENEAIIACTALTVCLFVFGLPFVNRVIQELGDVVYVSFVTGLLYPIFFLLSIVAYYNE